MNAAEGGTATMTREDVIDRFIKALNFPWSTGSPTIEGNYKTDFSALFEQLKREGLLDDKDARLTGDSLRQEVSARWPHARDLRGKQLMDAATAKWDKW